LISVKSKATSEKQDEIAKDIQRISERRHALEVSKFSRDNIEAAFIDELNLFEAKYKLLKE